MIGIALSRSNVLKKLFAIHRTPPKRKNLEKVPQKRNNVPLTMGIIFLAKRISRNGTNLIIMISI